MGLRSPFGYVGYEKSFAETFVYLIDHFCRSCHTEDDFAEGCRGCPVGVLIYAAKDYVLDAYEGNDEVLKKSKKLQKHRDLLRTMKKTIKPLGPYPCFNAQWVFEERLNPDLLEPLRKVIKDLEFYESQDSHPFHLEQNDWYVRDAMLEHDKALAKKVLSRSKVIREKREKQRVADEKAREREAKRRSKQKLGKPLRVMTPEDVLADLDE